MSAVEQYRTAAWKVWNSRKGDANLVKASAAEHGVKISEGYFFKPVQGRAYNPRIPYASAREASQIAKVDTVKRLCMDYRGSGQVGQIDRSSVAWIDAGGALQPDYTRFQEDMQLWDAIFALNPDVYVRLFYHVDVCGGGNYFTGGKVKEANERGNEDDYVQQFVRPYADAVRKMRQAGGVELSKMW